MHVPTYLLALHAHGPRFTPPLERTDPTFLVEPRLNDFSESSKKEKIDKDMVKKRIKMIIFPPQIDQSSSVETEMRERKREREREKRERKRESEREKVKRIMSVQGNLR